ncbi:Chorismate dehydratase [Planctomycetales bacterium 10988]|nr:Chorismate dehydratase [Planctomycetales bacterium 10988]
MKQQPTIRVGAVNYLNTKPLICGLRDIAPHLDLVLDLPSRLADRMHRGELDVALIPSVKAFEHPEYTILSDACIGCRGPVRSVKVFFRVPPAEVRTLALDEGSRTSAALTKVLLWQRFQLKPNTEQLPIGSTVKDSNADAVLLIGDRAMFHPPGEFVEVWDLGEEWVQWAKLPFVFAMWVARPGVDLSLVEGPLGAARDLGLRHLEKICAEEASALALTEEECLVYLRDHLHFFLGPQEKSGLLRFHTYCQQLGIIPHGQQLEFGHRQTSR